MAIAKRKPVKSKAKSKKVATKLKVTKQTPKKSKVAAKSKKKTASRGKVTAAYTKTQLLTKLAEKADVSKKQISIILDNLKDIIRLHLKKGTVEKFTLPGLLKITVKNVPARKAKKGTNPFTGEPMTFKAKPASRKVKIAALKGLKELA